MKKLAALLVLALAAVALVACGSSSSTEAESTSEAPAKEETSEGSKEAGGGGGTISIEANPEGSLEFEESSVSAKAGKDTLEFTNESPVSHDVKIEDSSGEEVGGVEIVAEGTESASVELEPGEYTFFCSVPGHRQAGMEGTLTVK